MIEGVGEIDDMAYRSDIIQKLNEEFNVENEVNTFKSAWAQQEHKTDDYSMKINENSR